MYKHYITKSTYINLLVFGFLLCCTSTAMAAGPDRLVNTSLVQSDGKIIIGGDFENYSGVARRKIARLNSDGSLDSGFNPGVGPRYFGNLTQATTYAVAIQSDGKVIVGGRFTTYNGVTRNYIARLNADGTLDTTFNTGTTFLTDVHAIRIQSDGKIVVGVYNGAVYRLNGDGTVDNSFTINSAVLGSSGSSIYDLAIQSDGKIIVGGDCGGGSNKNVVRLNTDGTVDSTFATIMDGFTEPVLETPRVYAVYAQSDGKIIVGGNFSAYNGTAVNNIARFNADGTLDTGFDPGDGTDGLSDDVETITVQSDNKIIVGGQFTLFDNVVRVGFARINADGSLDTSFDTSSLFGNHVFTTFVQSDGKIFAGGQFSTTNGTNVNYIARVNADGTHDSTFLAPTVAASVTTGIPTGILATAANGVGTIISTGGEDPQRYIDWGTVSGTYSNSCSAGLGSVGAYSCAMTGLVPSTTYYVRARAVNSAGTAYGDEMTFNTTNPPTGLEEHIIAHEFFGGGTAQSWRGDDSSWIYNLPFTFDFYGVAYSDIRISSNGYICLNSTYGCSSTSVDLDSASNGPIIVPMNVDLRTDINADNDIYIAEESDHVIVRWSAVEYGNSDTINFEVILYDNGNIKMNYGVQNNPPLSRGAVVGISNGDTYAYTASVYDTNVNFDQIDTSAWGDFPEAGVINNGLTLTATIAENMTLTCGSDIDIDNGTTLIPGTPLTNTTTCSVTTNDSSGYDLQLTNDRGTNNTLYHDTLSTDPNGQIPDKPRWDPNTPNAQTFTDTGLAFGILSSTATKNNSWWGTATTCTDTNQLYAGIPDTTTDIMRHETYSNTHTDTTICYQVNVPSTQIAGEYTGSVTYTATGRP